jgi:hypothetical protein
MDYRYVRFLKTNLNQGLSCVYYISNLVPHVNVRSEIPPVSFLTARCLVSVINIAGTRHKCRVFVCLFVCFQFIWHCVALLVSLRQAKCVCFSSGDVLIRYPISSRSSHRTSLTGNVAILKFSPPMLLASVTLSTAGEMTQTYLFFKQYGLPSQISNKVCL